MELKSWNIENGFMTAGGAQQTALELAQWAAQSFFPTTPVNALAHMQNNYPAVSIGFFEPVTITEVRPIDNRLYKEAGRRRAPFKTLLAAFRDACNIVWSNPGYVVSEPQRNGKWQEILSRWISNTTDDELFSVDLGQYWNPANRPTPWTGTGNLPWDGLFRLYFRLGNPLVDQRLFTVFLRRRPRIYGRSDRPAWRKIHDELEAGRKFVRNKSQPGR